MDTLLARRDELGLAAAERTDVVVVLRGGPDPFRRTGRLYDELRGQCCNALADRWCSENGLLKSFAGSHHTFGEEVSRQLVQAWVSKMQWVFQPRSVRATSLPFYGRCSCRVRGGRWCTPFIRRGLTGRPSPPCSGTQDAATLACHAPYLRPFWRVCFDTCLKLKGERPTALRHSPCTTI